MVKWLNNPGTGIYASSGGKGIRMWNLVNHAPVIMEKNFEKVEGRDFYY